MSRKWHLYILAEIVLAFASCTNRFQKSVYDDQLGEIAEERYKVDKTASSIIDSLKTLNIDSILYIRFYLDGAPNYQPLLLDKYRSKFKKGAHIAPLSHAQPAYIFWCEDGAYYVKKLDQFYAYKSIERERYQHFPLYDFYSRESKRLKSEKRLEVYYDTIPVPKDYAPRIEKKSYPYRGEFGGLYVKQFAHNSIDIKFLADSVQFSRHVNRYWFEPMLSTSTVKNASRIANDEDHYYINQQLAIYKWVQLIKSELFEIEMRQLWIKE